MDKLASYLEQHKTRYPKDMIRRQVAYERLRDAIRHAPLDPGEPLKEVRVSKLLGISRTPVREALRQLVQEGLAESVPGHGVTVATRTMQDLLDVVHIRSLLEPELVRLVAEAIKPDELERLEEMMQAMEAAGAADLEGWSRADVVYHALIRDACPNRLLGETVVGLRNRVHHLANIDTQTDPDRLATCTREHREVVDALKNRDGHAAKASMERHLAALTNSLLRRVSYR